MNIALFTKKNEENQTYFSYLFVSYSQYFYTPNIILLFKSHSIPNISNHVNSDSKFFLHHKT
jgi:hypothetical protein